MRGGSIVPCGSQVRHVKWYLVSYPSRVGMLMALTLILLACVSVRDLHGSQLTSGNSPQRLQERSGAGVRAARDVRGTGVLPGCPSTPPGLLGRLEVEENVTVEEAEGRVLGVRRGGFWWPPECVARWRVAVIVPYRDRAHQVGAFLNHMHPFLQRQQLNYSIYIVEQNGTDLFNRARLLNVGFLRARKEGPWDCYAFHDIDMLPLNDYHLYHCTAQPRHLAVAPSNHNYKSAHKLPYLQYFGGACLMTAGHLGRVNGWSNVYWGWGGEDDDMWRRVKLTDMSVWRYPAHYATYKMIAHKPQKVNPNRYALVNKNTGNFPHDGLTNLNFTIISTTRKALYTHLLADIGSSATPGSKGGRLPLHRPRFT